VQLKPGEKRPRFLEPLAVPMDDLAAVLKHVHFIQAKFFEIDDTLTDLHVPWDKIIPLLVLDQAWRRVTGRLPSPLQPVRASRTPVSARQRTTAAGVRDSGVRL